MPPARPRRGGVDGRGDPRQAVAAKREKENDNEKRGDLKGVMPFRLAGRATPGQHPWAMRQAMSASSGSPEGLTFLNGVIGGRRRNAESGLDFFMVSAEFSFSLSFSFSRVNQTMSPATGVCRCVHGIAAPALFISLSLSLSLV